MRVYSKIVAVLVVSLVAITCLAQERPKSKASNQASAREQAERFVRQHFGPTDLLQMDRQAPSNSRLVHDSPDSPESRLIGGPIQEHPDKASRANPIAYVSKDDPPFLIVHGDQDPLVPIQQSQLLADALDKAGVAVTFHTVQGGGHGFRDPRGQQACPCLLRQASASRQSEVTGQLHAICSESSLRAGQRVPTDPCVCCHCSSLGQFCACRHVPRWG